MPRLDFPDAAFDVVYSFGVLHHVPHPERAFAEARRVLRPGGRFVGGVYNRHSAWYLALRARRLVGLEWRRETLEQRHARIEVSSGEHGAHVRVFSARELRRLLEVAGFRDVRLIRRHSGFAPRGRRLPAVVDDAIGRAAGWYLVFEATR